MTHPFFGTILAKEYPPFVGDLAAYVYFEDFFELDTAHWRITTTEAGAGSATEAISATERGGVLVVTNDAADNDADFFNHLVEAFSFVSGKRTMFAVRFKTSDATESDLVFGLQITDTTPLAVSDGVYFQKDDGDTNVDFHVTKDSTSTSTTGVGTLADDTWMTLAFEYDGHEEIKYYVDGSYGGAVAFTNMPDDENLCVSFGIQNGAAASKVLYVDYVYAAQER